MTSNFEPERLDTLAAALSRLADAAEAVSADQSYAKDPRCGIVQPITAAEGQELNNAINHARGVLCRLAKLKTGC